MKKALTLFLMLTICIIGAQAKVQKAYGDVDGKYKVVLYYEILNNGNVKLIKYGYTKTIKKNPNSKAAYLYINRTVPMGGQAQVAVKDHKGKVVEHWVATPWYYRGLYTLTAEAVTTNGKRFYISFEL